MGAGYDLIHADIEHFHHCGQVLLDRVGVEYHSFYLHPNLLYSSYPSYPHKMDFESLALFIVLGGFFLI